MLRKTCEIFQIFTFRKQYITISDNDPESPVKSPDLKKLKR